MSKFDHTISYLSIYLAPLLSVGGATPASRLTTSCLDVAWLPQSRLVAFTVALDTRFPAGMTSFV